MQTRGNAVLAPDVVSRLQYRVLVPLSLRLRLRCVYLLGGVWLDGRIFICSRVPLGDITHVCAAEFHTIVIVGLTKKSSDWIRAVVSEV